VGAPNLAHAAFTKKAGHLIRADTRTWADEHSSPILCDCSRLPADVRSRLTIVSRRRPRRRLLIDFPLVQTRLTREEHAQPVGRADHGPPGESHAHRTHGASAVDPHASLTGQASYRRVQFRTSGENGWRASHFVNESGESRSREHDRNVRASYNLVTRHARRSHQVRCRRHTDNTRPQWRPR
jgi:hypothetical protein